MEDEIGRRVVLVKNKTLVFKKKPYSLALPRIRGSAMDTEGRMPIPIIYDKLLPLPLLPLLRVIEQYVDEMKYEEIESVLEEIFQLK
jgi:hypothetical protein